MTDLIETIDTIIHDAQWAQACKWSPEKMNEFMVSILANARRAREDALDYALVYGGLQDDNT